MQIADRLQIERMLERIVYQIAENHFDKNAITLVGLQESGLILAKEVAARLQNTITAKLQIVSLSIDKKDPSKSSIHLSDPISSKSEVVILVDDVINSGRTLFYALRPFLEINLKNLQTLVLVERKYKRFPVSSDYVGISLNTTLKEHIEVQVKNGIAASIELV
jgi:pyrimidine operon attenuation protein/uracil phosphoribosyltransferase